ncbi:VWA domain-containing protein [Maledivibacter halophilus]|uniref:Uncharacterized protein containing a von Willebrand factor type A (VWA) domain n=1 Tax=Maledivibacter halophilus TaxID=36842 RepID=A0A1T5J3L0_9FIRM|nr:VWA domain-containing protein [Maledivibacter halophilus]SKC45823.1 Uncharacterized protein containing a von Willebrand factor type A (vWA) domain [Maledivibacter halophilus]
MLYNFQGNIITLIISSIVSLYFAFQIKNSYRVIDEKKRKYWIFIRILTLICLILSLTQLDIDFSARNTTTIFLVDKSISADKNKERIEEYLNHQLKLKESKDKMGIIVFGEKPMIEMPIKDKIEKINLSSNINSNFTNIEEALDFAVNFFPEKTNKRLVLISDGRENMGNAVEKINKLRENKISLEIYPINTEKVKDVQLTSLGIPENIHNKNDIPVEIIIDSNFDGEGTFIFYGNNEEILKKDLRVENGENVFKYSISLEDNERINYRGEIVFKEDKNYKNNKASGVLNIGNRPESLIIGKDEDIKNLRGVLKSMDLNPIVYSSGEVPDNMNFLSQFNGIFLVNLHHDNISSEFEENLQKCVKNLGTGLVIIGGEESFALGEYKDTILEDILPLECDMKGNKKLPNTGLILIIDSSGSMEDESHGVKKIDMAKEASLRSIGILNENDYIGVLGFSDTLEWIVPFKSAEDKEKIKENILKLSSRGGTLILPALDEGINAFENAPVKIKHIILLSDGQGEKEGYENYINKMKEKSITLSTVGIGQDANIEVLKKLSKEAKGRNYFVKDFTSIPKIFAKETYLATKKYINNEEFTPIKVENTKYFNYDQFPNLKGYVGTGIKEGATLVLKSPLDDPILSHWQYGLGRVLVWTSDLNGRWSDSWIKWDKFQEKWSSIVGWIFSRGKNKEMEIDLVKTRGKLEIFAAHNNPKENSKFKIQVQGPKEFKENILLNQISTGKYKGEFSLNEEGSYYVTAELIRDSETIERKIETINLNYSPEHEINKGRGIERLNLIREISKGRLIDEDTNVFKQPIDKNKSSLDLSFILLPLALLFYIGDIAIRKL